MKFSVFIILIITVKVSAEMVGVSTGSLIIDASKVGIDSTTWVVMKPAEGFDDIVPKKDREWYTLEEFLENGRMVEVLKKMGYEVRWWKPIKKEKSK